MRNFRESWLKKRLHYLRIKARSQSFKMRSKGKNSKMRYSKRNWMHYSIIPLICRSNMIRWFNKMLIRHRHSGNYSKMIYLQGLLNIRGRFKSWEILLIQKKKKKINIYQILNWVQTTFIPNNSSKSRQPKWSIFKSQWRNTSADSPCVKKSGVTSCKKIRWTTREQRHSRPN